DPLARHRVLQLVSVAMIAAGIVLPIAVLATNPKLLSQDQTIESVQKLIGPVLLLGAGGLLLVIGLVLNAIRALIVRAALPPERYRGLAIVGPLLLALLLGARV